MTRIFLILIAHFIYMHFLSQESCSEQDLEDDLLNASMQMSKHKRKLEIQRETLSQIQLEISQLQGFLILF